MRLLGLFAVFSMVLCGFSEGSYAKKATYQSWIYTDWYTADFEPYIGRQKLGQPSIKGSDTWTPQDWVEKEGDEKQIIRDFYEGGIIVKQYIGRKNIPVLRVGRPFVELSNFDQVRILRFIDYVFEITTSETDGMYYVYYERDDNEPLGLYNKFGFQSY